jgi:hypothetical protein
MSWYWNNYNRRVTTGPYGYKWAAWLCKPLGGKWYLGHVGYYK